MYHLASLLLKLSLQFQHSARIHHLAYVLSTSFLQLQNIFSNSFRMHTLKASMVSKFSQHFTTIVSKRVIMYNLASLFSKYSALISKISCLLISVLMTVLPFKTSMFSNFLGGTGTLPHAFQYKSLDPPLVYISILQYRAVTIRITSR